MVHSHSGGADQHQLREGRSQQLVSSYQGVAVLLTDQTLAQWGGLRSEGGSQSQSRCDQRGRREWRGGGPEVTDALREGLRSVRGH